MPATSPTARLKVCKINNMTEIEQMSTRLRELEGWAREHDGRINEKWESQERENALCAKDRAELRDHIDAKFGQVFKKLSALETKVATFAGIAALVGSAAVKYLLP